MLSTQVLARPDLNLDHVVPRSQGGKTTWENVVTSCIPCNRKKGGVSPAEVGMKLIIVDFTYWNLELKED